MPLSPQETLIRNHGVLIMVTYFISYPIVEFLDVVDSKRKKPKKSEDPGLLALVLITVIPTLLVFGAVAIEFMGIVFGFQASDRLHIGHLKTVHQKVGVAILVLDSSTIGLRILAWCCLSPKFTSKIANRLKFCRVFTLFGLVVYEAYNGLFTEWDAATGGIHPVSPSAKRTSLAFIILSGLLLALSAVIHCWKRLTRDSDSDA